jgi:glycerol-3-phosphate dehydrogenase (NAD+)
LKMGAKPSTITGLSGTGDIMLTCFVNLSRNRTVGVRLGSGEKLDDILSSMNQVLVNTFMYLLSVDNRNFAYR